MTTKHANARQARRQARLARLPRLTREMFADDQLARTFLAFAPFTRMMIGAGIVPTPGYGLAQHDAGIAIIRDIIGEVSLSDTDFEMALRTMTPPEAMQ
jgi:hypothetical protein